MTTPTVRELPRSLQPTSPDVFVDSVAGDSAERAPVRRAITPRSDVAALVCAARAGDEAAWAQLVQRFDRQLRSTARRYQLAPADVDEVVQATWLNLLENIQRIHKPAAVGGWLATTARHNALGRRQRRVREQLTDDPDVGSSAEADEPEVRVLAEERDATLSAAVSTLPVHQRRLVTVLLKQPALDYRQIGEMLSVPVGSIGPTRARALARLARDPQLQALNN
jgi:RNA polymerase sigma factor (sigma-70 family)